jgi:hypothetical protein
VGQELNYSGFTPPAEKMGFTKKVVDRVEFAGVLTLLVILIQGYDSLARPQLVSTLAPYFLELLLVTYLVGNYWIFSDTRMGKDNENGNQSKSLAAPDVTASSEKLAIGKMSNYIGLLAILLFALATTFNILANLAITPAFLVDAPGSHLVNGTVIVVSGVFLVVLVIPPACTVIGTWLVLPKLPGQRKIPA